MQQLVFEIATHKWITTEWA